MKMVHFNSGDFQVKDDINQDLGFRAIFGLSQFSKFN